MILLALAVLASVTALAAGGGSSKSEGNEKTEDYQAAPWAKEELGKADRNQLMPEPLAFQDLTKPITRQEYAATAVLLYDKLLALNPGVSNPNELGPGQEVRVG